LISTRNYGVLSPDPVVSNTTALILLVGVGLLALLHTLYHEIHIPEAVFAEIAGEAEAIALARTLSARLILLDERRRRAVA
jgi:predicted nucleic acid-binding protein